MSAAEADRFLDYLRTERNDTVALIITNIRRLQNFDYNIILILQLTEPLRSMNRATWNNHRIVTYVQVVDVRLDKGKYWTSQDTKEESRVLCQTVVPL